MQRYNIASMRLTFLALLALLACREKVAPPAAAPPAPTLSLQMSPPRTDVACAAPFDAPGAREKLRAELKGRGADVLIAAGDLGDNPDEQETLLGAVAESGLPVIAVAGNREVRSDLDAAEAELRKKGARIIDLSRTRIVDLGDATVVGLPGAFERRQLHAEGACIYAQREIDAVAAVLDRLPRPTLLVAAVPPRGQDARALDVSEGQNVGDPRLSPLLQKAQFAIFGQVWESGGRAIDGRGAPVPPTTDSPQLYLNPGAADRTPWPMADGSTVPGQAALLTVHGRNAAWEQVRPAEEKR